MGLEPEYHEPFTKQMANHITLGALLIEIQHIPLQKYDSHQMLCMWQALVYHVLFCGTVYEMVKNIEKTEWRRCVKIIFVR